MYIIVGLGNPKKEYEKTRHNVGFIALDKIAQQNSFPEFSLSKKHSSFVSEGILSEIKVLLAKPQTFMNNSGKAVASLVKLNLKKSNLAKELIIIHDDIDIPLGEIKVSEGKGSAGHKGVESIIKTLGTKNFTRVRIGIQPKKGKPTNVETFVLKKFSKEELSLLQSSIKQTTQAITLLIP